MTKRLGSYGKPYWLYCHSLYPIAHEGVWGCFAQNVIGAVDIGIELLSIACLVQPPLDSSPTEAWLLFHFAIGRKGDAIQKARFAGIAFLLQDDPYSHQ